MEKLELTYCEERRYSGKNYSCSIPDSFHSYENYEDSSEPELGINMPAFNEITENEITKRELLICESQTSEEDNLKNSDLYIASTPGFESFFEDVETAFFVMKMNYIDNHFTDEDVVIQDFHNGLVSGGYIVEKKNNETVYHCVLGEKRAYAFDFCFLREFSQEDMNKAVVGWLDTFEFYNYESKEGNYCDYYDIHVAYPELEEILLKVERRKKNLKSQITKANKPFFEDSPISRKNDARIKKIRDNTILLLESYVEEQLNDIKTLDSIAASINATSLLVLYAVDIMKQCYDSLFFSYKIEFNNSLQEEVKSVIPDEASGIILKWEKNITKLPIVVLDRKKEKTKFLKSRQKAIISYCEINSDRIAESKSALEAANKEIIIKEAEIEGNKKIYVDKVNEINQKEKELDTLNEELNNKLRDKEKELFVLRKKEEGFNTQIEDLRSRKQTEESRMESNAIVYQQNRNSFLSYIESLEKEIENLNNELTLIKAEEGKLREEANKSFLFKKSKLSKADALLPRIEELSQNICKTENSKADGLKQLENERIEFERLNDEFNKIIEPMNVAIDDIDAEIKRNFCEENRIIDELSGLTKEAEIVKSSKVKLEEELKDAAKLENKNKTLEKETETLKAHFADLKQENGFLTKRQVLLEAEGLGLDSRINKLSDEVKKEKKEIDKEKRQLESEKAAIVKPVIEADNKNAEDVIVESTVEGSITKRKENLKKTGANFIIDGDMLLEYSGNEKIVKIPDGVKKVADIFYNPHEFIDHKSEELIFPDGVEELGIGAMWGCETLRRIVIPASVKKISPFVFCTRPNNNRNKIENYEKGFSEDEFSIKDFSYPNLHLYLALSRGLVFVVERNSYAEEFLANFQLDPKECRFPIIYVYKEQDINDIDFSTLCYEKTGEDSLSVGFPDTRSYKGKKKCIIPAYVGNRKVTVLRSLDTLSETEELVIPETVEKIRITSWGSSIKLSKLVIHPDNQHFYTDGKGLYSFDKKRFLCLLRNVENTYTILDGVEEIGDYAFAKCSGLYNLELPDSLKEIGENAFHGCENLKSIHGLDSVCSAGKNAFCLDDFGARKMIPYCEESYTGIIGRVFLECTNKKLKKFEVPDGIEEIGFDAFRGCSELNEIVIPDSVKSIRDRAFKDCVLLKEIHLPKNLKYLGEGVFPSHEKNPETSYAGVSISEENPCFSTKDGILYSKDQSILYYVPDIYKDKELVIPEKVRTVKEYACHNNLTIQKVIFQSNVIFQRYCFSDCQNLSTIVFHDAQTSIGEMTGLQSDPEKREIGRARGIFYNCNKLKNVTFSDKISVIGEAAFEKCGIEKIILPKGLLEIGLDAFYRNPIKKIELPNGIRRIASHAFFESKITEVVLPSSVINTGTEIMGLMLKKLTVYDSIEPNGLEEVFKGQYSNETMDSNVGRIPGLSKEGCCITVLSAETNDEKFRVYMPSSQREKDYWKYAYAWNSHAEFDFNVIYKSFNFLTDHKLEVALERLHHENEIPEEVKSDMVRFVKKNAKSIINAYIDKNNFKEIQFCEHMGIIDGQEIDSAILYAKKTGNEEIEKFLMGIRTDKLQITGPLDENAKRAPVITGLVMVDNLKNKKDILKDIRSIDYAQVYFRGYKSEIEKMKSYLSKNNRVWDKEYEIGEEFSELSVNPGEYVVALISEYPQLKATGLVEYWKNYSVLTLYSESGYPYFTDYTRSGDFDPKDEGGDGRWAYFYDMMGGISGSYSDIQTGVKVNYGYHFPYKKEWDDLNTCYIEKEGFIYRKETELTKDEIKKILLSRHQIRKNSEGVVVEEPSFTVSLSGTQYEGRIERIEKVKVGDVLSLVREPNNQYDSNAINVCNSKGSLGHVPAGEAKEIASLLDEGYYGYTAKVVEVTPLSQRSKKAKNAILVVSICFAKPK